MSYDVWDVIFTKVPNQEDNTKFTKRPAIILNKKQYSVVICPITTKIHQARHYKETILIKSGTKECKTMNLDYDSLIVVDRIEEIDLYWVEFKFGKCPPSIRTKINNCRTRLGK